MSGLSPDFKKDVEKLEKGLQVATRMISVLEG